MKANISQYTVLKHIKKGKNMFTICFTYVTNAYKSYVKHTGFYYTFKCVETLVQHTYNIFETYLAHFAVNADDK